MTLAADPVGGAAASAPPTGPHRPAPAPLDTAPLGTAPLGTAPLGTAPLDTAHPSAPPASAARLAGAQRGPTGIGHPTHPSVPPAARRPGGPWAAWSPCTPAHCLPARATTGRWRMVRRAAVLLAVLALALLTVPLAAAVGSRALGPVLRALHRAVLRAAGVRLVVRGGPLAPADGRGALVVADHTSWIDIPALGAIGPVTMLAKREVRDWPLIGMLAALVGTVFVHREGLSRLPVTVATVTAALRSGALVGVFPEATTWCGAVGGDYRRAPFQAAIDAGVPVRPVTIALTTPDGRPTTAGAFVGGQTLGDTLGRVLRLPGLVCEVRVGDLVEPGTDDRRALAGRACERVRRPGRG
ncbi:1-acyl-sn-glycerol-3-phosphate acyltransferase [Pseudonocardia sp. NPDC049635]|uniref:1-acyl-sn-glycerol-3-phosphate acyltransferase n=1 Tax=Pseudonocardia sp. NPDC049635 TaxID=3155506 RepID=UPI0033D739F1